MKKILILIVLIALCCGCKKDDGNRESIAGSVSVSGYRAKYEASFGGIPQNPTLNTVYIFDVSDTEITFDCGIPDAVEIPFHFSINIPSIPLSGKAGDVRFDHYSSDTRVWLNGIEYGPVAATIKGWIKEDDTTNTRKSPIIWEYDCDIYIECNADGKPLKLHITRIEPL